MSKDRARMARMLRRWAPLSVAAAVMLTLGTAPTQARFDNGPPPVRTSPSAISWDLPGEAPEVSIAYATDSSMCDGDAPCWRLYDPTNDSASTPCPDIEPGRAYLGVCPTKNADGLTVTGYALGVRVEQPAGIPSCGPTVTLRQLAGATDTRIENRCAERVECTGAYVGTIYADARDAVADSCKWLVVNGQTLRTAADPSTPTAGLPHARCGGSCGIPTQAATGGTAPDAVVPKPSGVPTDAGFLRQRRATIQSVAASRTTTGALMVEATVKPGVDITVMLQSRTSRGLVRVARLVRVSRRGHLSLLVRRPFAAPVVRVVLEAGASRVTDAVDGVSAR